MTELAARILSGDVAAVARACRVVDERASGHVELSRELFPHSRRARIVGLTGSPGAGKSTLTDGLVARLRARGERVGVVAIDPSSPFSGGALLGDRIRMLRHAGDDGVFIRSLATRGARGGLSRSAADVVRVLAAWGAHSVLVETVGVGQAELDVLGLAHTVVVVVVPGAGDDVQANKAGIVEIADVFALNKADREGVDAAERELAVALGLGAPGGGFVPPIVRTVATRGEGLDELLAAVDRHALWLCESAEGRARRERRERQNLGAFLRDVIADDVLSALGTSVESAIANVLAGESDPYAESARLLAEFRERPGTGGAVLSAEPGDSPR